MRLAVFVVWFVFFLSLCLVCHVQKMTNRNHADNFVLLLSSNRHTKQTIKVRRSLTMFFTCIAKDDMMLYFVILGYGIQREAKFANMSFSNDIGREWPMPLPARGTDVWMFPFDEMADDGIIMMERFLATLGLTNVDVGRTFHVPLTMVVNKKTRNEDLMRTRMSWLVPDNMPSGTQCVISMPKMIEQISFEFFVQADLLRCDECFFASFKLKITDNIWADHSGNFFYGLELQEDGRHGKTVTAKKLCGDKDPQTKIWRYRDAPTVPVGFKGWEPERFCWQLDGFSLVSGVGMRMPGVAGGHIFPLYMLLLRP